MFRSHVMQVPDGGVSVSDLSAESAAILRQAGVEDANAETRWLLRHLLQMTESSLLAWPDVEIPAVHAERVRRAVRRRAAHEPFSYVVGSRELYGRTFAVDRR